MIVDKIYEYLTKKEKTLDDYLLEEVSKLSRFAFKRQFMTEDSDERKLRLSSAGKCPRQLSYLINGFEKKGREIDSRAKLIFWTGDLAELTIVSLAKCAGVPMLATGLNQLKVSITISGKEILGHPDGLVLHEGTALLLEVKSMSSYSFDSFVKGNLDSSYWVQVNEYMHALKLTMCIFVAINKDNGLLHEMIVYYDEELHKRTVTSLSLVINSNKDVLPERPFKPDEKGFYPWNCAYCAFYTTCLIEPKLAEKVTVNNSTKLKAVLDGNPTPVKPTVRRKTVSAS